MPMKNSKTITTPNTYKHYLLKMNLKTSKCFHCIFIMKFSKISLYFYMLRTVSIKKINTWQVSIEITLSKLINISIIINFQNQKPPIQMKTCQSSEKTTSYLRENSNKKVLKFTFTIKSSKSTLMLQCIITNRYWMVFLGSLSTIKILPCLKLKMLLSKKCQKMQNSSEPKYLTRNPNKNLTKVKWNRSNKLKIKTHLKNISMKMNLKMILSVKP